MGNPQSTIDLLRELNSDLVHQIAELRKKFVEVEAENIEVKAENAKLRQNMEEYEIRFAKLEQNDKEKTNLIAKLDDDIKGIKQDQIVAISLGAESKHKLANSCLISDSSSESQITSPFTEAHSGKETSIHCETNDSITSITPITPKQIVSQRVDVPASHILTEAKSLEDKEMDDFLDSTYKEKVSKEIIQSIKEKKLWDQNLSLEPSYDDQNLESSIISQPISNSSELSSDNNSLERSTLSCDIKTVTNGNDQNLELACDIKTVDIGANQPPADNNTELYSSDSSDEVSGLDRNQITEQTLKWDFTKPIIITKSIEIDDKLSLEKIIEGSTQRLAYWFEKAIKSGIKEILYWYNYSFETENKVKNMMADGKIKEKTARSMIYKEMLKYLPNVTSGNLQIRTNRAKKFLKLFGEKGVGIDKIKLVTCSASDISRLTNAQIQNVINYVNDHDHANSKTVTNGNDQNNIPESSISPILNSKARVSALPVFEPEIKVNPLSITRFNPVNSCASFRRKVLDQYSDIYYEYSNGGVDYYRINAETLCPICKLNHEDGKGVEGNYEAGSYYIKCEASEIDMIQYIGRASSADAEIIV
ncbi:hypothetical protein Glove_510g16 [Diversispora epigaea]|uniref:Uncharacterized protein n=1 Tax=Diversispora epigaea TaxID=1348612 RepID=A0A397GJN0_9GLOM|nr:hypothetical protein Glove_510g16 [Diversispora epigaea]